MFVLIVLYSLAISTLIWHKEEMKNKFWFEYETCPEKDSIKTICILLVLLTTFMYDCFLV